MKLKFSLIVLAMLASQLITAQEKYLADIDAAKKISFEVSDHFRNLKITDAIDKLRPYWPLPVNEINHIETKTIQSLNVIDERFGKPESIVKVNEQHIKDTAFKETYLLKFEYTAIRLIFIYYKNKNGWIVNAFSWDDSFAEEFK